MENEAVGHLDRKLPKNLIVEALDAEKQLWRLVHSKGITHADVRELYLKACSSYEKIILQDHELAELQDIEYSLWKLHYKHIDEYRNGLRDTMNLAMRKNASTVEQDRDNLLEEFKSFLSEATEFYQSLIKKIRKNNGLQEGLLFFDEGGFPSHMDSTKLCRIQFSCHRYLISLGDLARYRELYGNPVLQNRNWSVAATHYLNASMIWPDSGNPQNQLAVLATYVGDELLALYHCTRSLAVKEPFPDAWDNLILLFEKNGSSHLDSLCNEATFDFFKPFEGSTVLFKAQSKNDSSSMLQLREDAEESLSNKTGLWSLIVRMISFFYIKSSLDEFPFIFGSVVRELEALLSLDDATLKAALESYQQMGIPRLGPFRVLQLTAILIFTVQTLGESSKLQKGRYIKYMQQPDLIKLALASTFICMGRLVNRCKATNPVESSPLLPSILVFVEFLVQALDKAETYETDGICAKAISYFFSTFVDLLNHFSYAMDQGPDFVALWEDNELRGFSPIAQSHVSLKFINFEGLRRGIEGKRESQARVSRIIAAAMKVVNRSNEFCKWIFYDKIRRKFHVSELEKLPGGIQAEEAAEPILPLQKAKEQLGVEEGGKDDYNKVDAIRNSSPPVEEEEVILFKPIARYNSAPIYLPVVTTGDKPTASIWDFKKPIGERLHRGASFPENQFCFDPANSHSNGTESSSSKSFWHEPIPEDSEMDSFSDHPTEIGTVDVKTDGLPSAAGPPSLSAWVVNRENLGIGRGEIPKDSSKYQPGSNIDMASSYLTGLSFGETAVTQQETMIASSTAASHFMYGSSSMADSIIQPQYSSETTHHSLPPYYTPPLPSAPLLPDDASWYGGNSYNYEEQNNSEDITGKISRILQVNNSSHLSRTQVTPNYDPSSPRLNDKFPPLSGRTSSPQWPHLHRENLNIDRVHDHGLPPFHHLYTPTSSLERLQDHNVSRLQQPDRWTNPSVSYSHQYMEDPSLRPGFHLNYGANEQRRDKLFHGYQRPAPYRYGALQELMPEQQLLLQYLKEKEWRVQPEAPLRGP